MLGFSAPRCIAIGLGALTVLLGLLAGGGPGLLFSAPLWTLLVALAFVTRKDQPLVEWIPSVLHWSFRVSMKQTTYRARVSAPRPAGTMALPGDAAALRFYEDADSGACMVHDPHRQSLSVTVAVTHPAYVLLSAVDQATRVSAWGKLLASL